MLLNLPLILETRRNHALEHATLHILARTYHTSMAGHSNPTGFYLLGDIQIEDIADAATEAMKRLKAGESGLAVHPGCGTNLVATALLPATFAWAPIQGAKSTRWRLLLIPLALVFAVFGYMLSNPSVPGCKSTSPPKRTLATCTSQRYSLCVKVFIESSRNN